MSDAVAAAPRSTPLSSLDTLVQRTREGSQAWVRLPLEEKRRLLAEVRRRVFELAEEWVAAACEAKGIAPDSPLRGEEWIGGPVITIRTVRLLERSLKDIQEVGAPRIPDNALRTLPDGRLAVRVYPQDLLDGALLMGHTVEVYLQPGIHAGNLTEHQASFYRRPHSGRVCVVLGGGNVNAIPPTDCLYKLIVEGAACILKMNPVNAYVGPFLEKAFAPLTEKGVFSVVYGGAEEGGFLVNHPAVDEIHITGSDKTHDALVWGPPGPEREQRKASGTPLLKKAITSELGNITPVVVVPGPYREGDLEFQGRSIAGMVTQNASFNCNSAKLLVTPEGAPFRAQLLRVVEEGMAQVSPRRAWYPGAEERWRAFTEGRSGVRFVGADRAQPGTLPWALLEQVDPSRVDDRVFHQEPWCAVLSETSLPATSVSRFLEEATRFLNSQVWGTLCATLIVHPETLEEPSTGEAVEKAIRELRYGSVAVNTWPAATFGLASPPWGGHPSTTLENIQSGQGMVHNTLMLEGVEKSVIRAPLRPLVRPPWWPTHRSLDELGRKLAAFEYEPTWTQVPGLALTAMRA